MANFDFIDSASEGYKFVWEKRQDILPLAALPLVVKIALVSVITMMAMGDNFLRQGLLLIPFYVAEGWFLSVIIRMAIWGDNTRTLQFSGDGLAPEGAIRALRAGVIMFTLIKVIGAAVSGLAMDSGLAETMQGKPVAAGDPLMSFVAASGLLLITIWVFRLLWLYVPVALGYSVRGYMHAMRGFKSSFQIIALWLLCFVPIFVALLMGLEFINTTFPQANVAEGGARGFAQIAISALTTSAELAIDAISAAAAAFAVHHMMKKA